MAYTAPFNAGCSSAYLKSVYKWDKNLFYMLYTITDHDDKTLETAIDHEIDFVVSRNFTKSFYVTIKAGLGLKDKDDGAENTWQNDFRVFIGYKF
ncbi:MAG: hypothetical protein HRT88_16575 [Lentisphaeraceae bacterium]|nr:hypothetical protein [Lentisphaeraceae bacterium]